MRPLGFGMRDWAKATAGAVLVVVIGWACLVIVILAGSPA